MWRSKIAIGALLVGLALLVGRPSTVAAQPGQPIPEKSFSNLIAALNNVNSEIRALRNREFQNVLFANVRDMRDNLDESQNQMLDKAIEDANLEPLHDYLLNNKALSTALREKRRDKVHVKDVVAVDMLSDGDVVVYFESTL